MAKEKKDDGQEINPEVLKEMKKNNPEERTTWASLTFKKASIHVRPFEPEKESELFEIQQTTNVLDAKLMPGMVVTLEFLQDLSSKERMDITITDGSMEREWRKALKEQGATLKSIAKNLKRSCGETGPG